MKTGWECPVCHKGNAPFALKCGHCAEMVATQAPHQDMPTTWLERLAKRQVRRVEIAIQPIRIGDPPEDGGPGVVYVGTVKGGVPS